MASDIPTLRWGIISTGLISSWFVKDLLVDRQDAKARHVIQAIGSSSLEKGQNFAKTYLSGQTPAVYGDYESVYNDTNVDIVYIGTPHAFHKKNCLDAIKHGKHVLCEKAFTINKREAEEVFEAARKKNVFVMEAMWTRFFPLTRTLHRILHEERCIGDLQRVFCDFSMQMSIEALPNTSRLKDPALGAGSLLDIGVYSLTWGLLALDAEVGDRAPPLKVVGIQKLSSGIDIASSMLLHDSNSKQGIVTCSTTSKTDDGFCRIEGSDGVVIVKGEVTSQPSSFTVIRGGEAKEFEFPETGMGYYWEADAVALDIAAGKIQNDLMPWSETLRVLDILDEVRRQGGTTYPQDNE